MSQNDMIVAAAQRGDETKDWYFPLRVERHFLETGLPLSRGPGMGFITRQRRSNAFLRCGASSGMPRNIANCIFLATSIQSLCTNCIKDVSLRAPEDFCSSRTWCGRA